MSRLGSSRPFCAVMGAAALVLLLSACNGDDGNGGDGTSGPTTAVSGDVIFGSGSIPEGFPSDFPIPQAASIGSTLIDPNRSRYEVILFLPTGQDAALVFFSANLESAGYTITEERSDGNALRVAFEREGEMGNLFIRRESTGQTTVAVDLTIE